MLKSSALLKFLVLTLLLSALTLFLANIGESAEVEYTGTGYFITEQAARDILEGWTSDRAAKEAYRIALEELYTQWQVFRGDMTAQIAEIKESHAQERQEWQKELRRLRTPGFGVFGGVGYSTDGSVQGVIGVGLVWKIW